MKKLILTSIGLMAIFTINLTAQIKVLSNGKVGFGTSSPSYGRIQVGTDGEADGLGFYSSSTGGSTFRIYRKNDYGFITRAGSDTRGLRMDNTGAVRLYTSATANYSNTIITYSNNPLQKHYIVDNSGSHNFFVYGDGAAWSAKGYYTTSDSVTKENISDLSNALDKLTAIRGVTYSYKSAKERQSSVIENSLDEELPEAPEKSLSAGERKAEQYNKNKKRTGVLAQDVEAVLPEAVRMMPDGTKAVSYDELIPLLIEAIKEQQLQIESLKTNNAQADAATTETANLVDEILETEAALYQNVPNPFSENTEINYTLPEAVESAVMNIYDMQGTQIKSISLYDRGNSKLIISGSELQAGMYIYALIADGQEVDTKRMILTD